MTDYLKLLMHL